MPFTLFHLGPALVVGLALRKYLHTPTFILGNVILDIEPLLVIVLGVNYPLHGYLHTVISALAVGLLLGFVMFRLKGVMSPFYQKAKLEIGTSQRLRSFLSAGIFGAGLHILFDSLLYSEMSPFFPLTVNPLLDLHFSMSRVYWLCIGLGALGIVFYGFLLVHSLYKKAPKSQT